MIFKEEETLVQLAPAFAKLCNPLLRKTVAKVTTLRQAARVGGVSLGHLINTLRQAAGQPSSGACQDSSSPTQTRPAWLDGARVAERFDARPLIERGDHPLPAVMERLSRLNSSEVLVLVTPFEPAPLMDLAAQRGYAVWSRQVDAETWETSFGRQAR
ncbi:MAG: DUF2249 domain-containing protein [Planctomycetota bacterium]